MMMMMNYVMTLYNLCVMYIISCTTFRIIGLRFIVVRDQLAKSNVPKSEDEG
jgi:hypothetical protein